MKAFLKLAIPSLFVTLSLAASAQNTRSYVSGVGDDANPCTRTAPCKTFAGAISKTAAAGEIDVLDPGGFGAVTINKSMTIDGSGGAVASILVSNSPGITIAAGASDIVILRNLAINGYNGTGTVGVNVVSGGTVHIEKAAIFGFGTGIKATANAALNLTLDQVDIHDVSAAGLSVGNAVTVTVNDSNFLNASAGPGVLVSGTANATVKNSVSAGNSGAGFACANAASLTLVGSTAANNGGAGFSTDSTNGACLLSLVSSIASTNTGAGLAATGATKSIIRTTATQFLSNGGGIAVGSSALVGTYGDNVITNGLGGTTLTNLAKQ